MEVTSLEQSKKLLESGLSRESCDLWWIERYIGEWVGNDEEGKSIEYYKEPMVFLSLTNTAWYDYTNEKKVAIPAWSLGKLMSMFKSDGVCSPTFSLSSGGWKGEDADKEVEYTDDWFATYEDDDNAYVESDESAIGAVVKMILKLKEEGLEI